MRGMGPGNMAPVRIDLHTLVRYWLISPFTCAVLAALTLVAFWYFHAAADTAEQGRDWPVGRKAAFLSGLVAVELAFQSSVAMLPYISFPMQVMQKLLLFVAAPPLLALGAPLTLALETASPPTAQRLLRAARSAPVRVLTHPVSTFLLLYLGLLAYFLTPALGASMRHVWLLNLVNVGFLAVALPFWSAMLSAEEDVGAETSRARTLALLGGGVLLASILGVALISRTSPVAAIYTLSGTHAGGATLWAVSVVANLIAIVVVYSTWSREDDLADIDDAEEVPPPLRLSPQG